MQFSPVQFFDLHRVGHMSQRLVCVQVMIDRAGPYLAGGQGGQLPPLGKLNVDFFNEVFVFDGIFLVAILVQNLKKTG